MRLVSDSCPSLAEPNPHSDSFVSFLGRRTIGMEVVDHVPTEKKNPISILA